MTTSRRLVPLTFLCLLLLLGSVWLMPVPVSAQGGSCPSGTTRTVFASWDFTEGAGDWTTLITSTGVVTSPWVITTTNPSTLTSPSSGNSFFVADLDPSAAGEFLDSSLISPATLIPAEAVSATLQFWNYQEFEYPLDPSSGDFVCWDSGTLQVSTDSGASWTFVPSDTSVLLNDPFDFVVYSDTDYLHPFAGQPAWCPDTFDPNTGANGWQDWQNTVVDVTDLAGENPQFRWRFGIDGFAGAYGWHIDDVQVVGCLPESPTSVRVSQVSAGAPDTFLAWSIVGMISVGLLCVVGGAGMGTWARRRQRKQT